MTARALPPAHDGQAGIVFAEFLIAFPVVFLMFLSIVQLSLLGAASLVVQHAAYRAAREAALVLDDDPKHYDGAPRMRLSRGGGKSSSGLRSHAGRRRRSSAKSAKEGPRMQQVIDAAYLPLAALAPPPQVIASWLSGSTPALDEGALSDSWSMFAVAAFYTPRATTLRFEGKPEAGALQFQPGEMVHVKLTYVYACSVPLVNALVCGRLGPSLGSPLLDDALESLVPLPRVARLTGEASAAIHRGQYLYRSEQ